MNLLKLLSVNILIFIMCCGSALASSPINTFGGKSLELNNWPSAYLIKGDGSLAPIDKGRDSIKIGGDNLGIMFENVSADLIEYPVLKIEALVRNPLVLMGVVYKGEGYRKTHRYIHLNGDGEFHQYRLDFTAYPDRAKTIQTLYVYFINGDNGIDIKNISLNHSGNLLDRLSVAWENFTRPRLINIPDMNFIPSPRIFNASFITILHIFAAALLLVLLSWGIMWHWLKRKRISLGVIAPLLAIFLFTWIIADIRNMYNEFWHVKLTREGYLRPEAEEGEARFFDLRDYFGFLKFVKKNIPVGVTTATLYTPSFLYNLYVDLTSYHLYPTAVYQKSQGLFKVFYKYPFAETRGDTLYYMDMEGENRAVKGRLIKRWDKNSFLFLQSSNE